MVEESAPWDWDWLTAQGGYISLEPGYLGESILLGVFSKGLLKEKKGVVEGDARLYRQVADWNSTHHSHIHVYIMVPILRGLLLPHRGEAAAANVVVESQTMCSSCVRA